MKGQKFLKVTSILMIICGVMVPLGVIAILGISALAAFMERAPKVPACSMPAP